ncbi:MAG: EMC3/TMCO1 family protein [Nanoarchaeota archaeon]
MALGDFFNLIFGWSIKIHPAFGIAFISFVLTLFMTLVYKYLTDQMIMKGIKDDVKSIQTKMKDSKNNPQKLISLQKEAMEKNMKYMMHSFKPMLITFIPIIFIFSWLRNTYNGVDLDLLIIHSWIWGYIIFTFIFTYVLRKVLKVY